MTQASKILWFAFSAAAVLLLPNTARAQGATSGGATNSFVVATGHVGRGDAIAVDPRNVHLAFYDHGDPANGIPARVMYTAFPHSVQAPPGTIQIVDTLSINASDFGLDSISVASDSQDNPHIIYVDGLGGLKHATPVGGLWMTETVVASGAGVYNAIAIDKNDTLHVAYGAVRYATKSNGVWSNEPVIGVANMTGLSIAVDSKGIPQVAWGQHAPPSSEVEFARRANGHWFGNLEIVDDIDAYWVSLAIDANDNSSVAYLGWRGTGAPTGELDYAQRVAGVFSTFWQPQLVDVINSFCCFPNPFDLAMVSMGLSPSGDPRIAYGSTEGIKFARSAAGLFSNEVIDNPPDGLTFLSMGVDDTDASHIVFRGANSAACNVGQGCLIYDKISALNTPVGSSINVIEGAVTVKFNQVTQAGETTAAPGSGFAPPPPNFQLGNPPVAFDISTTAGFVPPVTVCVNYAASFPPTANLSLMHLENGVWVDRTVSVDTVQQIICATTNSLSPFEVFQQQAAQKPTLTITADNKTRQYGATEPAFSVSYSGFVNGDTPSVLGGSPTFSATGNPASPVGAYAINCTGLTSSNYIINFVPGVLSVTPAPLTVTAPSGSRPFGAANPALAPPLIAGIQNGDAIAGSDSIAATSASPVGMYAVVPSVLGAPNVLSNYTISLVNGALSVVSEATSMAVTLSPASISIGQSTLATITLTAPDMVIPIDPSVLANITLTSPVVSDILSNNGVCTPIASATSGVASCTVTVTSVEPDGRTLIANFPGSVDLASSTSSGMGTGQLIVTAALRSQQVCIASDFRNVAVAGGSTLWFNSIFKVRGVSQQLVHITFFGSFVQFQYADGSGNVVNVNQALPDARITIDPSAAAASTSFDAVNNVWNTTIPWDLDDSAFLTGMPWAVPAVGLPGDVEPVTVCGTFASDVTGADIGWRWAAAAYSSFSTDSATLGVKPVDTDHDNQATNHDHAGTPENFKQFVIPGARGKGGKNYTGTYSRSVVIE